LGKPFCNVFRAMTMQRSYGQAASANRLATTSQCFFAGEMGLFELRQDIVPDRLKLGAARSPYHDV
jgi:hypothetical protein